MRAQTESRTAKPLLRVLRGETPTRPPYWLMRQAGRYLPEYRKIRAEAGDFLDLCYAPELAAEVTLQPVERFAMDAAILFSDILVVPHGLGRKVAFLEGEGPSLEPLREAGEVASLSLDRMLGHLAPVYETVTRVRGRLPAEAALIGFAGAPWTVATYMLEGGSSRDFAAAKHWMRARTADFEALIDVLVEATVAHLSAQAAAGAEVVQIFDSWASALEGDEFERWSVEPARRIVAGLKQSHPEVPVIGFPRGAATEEPQHLSKPAWVFLLGERHRDGQKTPCGYLDPQTGLYNQGKSIFRSLPRSLSCPWRYDREQGRSRQSLCNGLLL